MAGLARVRVAPPPRHGGSDQLPSDFETRAYSLYVPYIIYLRWKRKNLDGFARFERGKNRGAAVARAGVQRVYCDAMQIELERHSTQYAINSRLTGEMPLVNFEGIIPDGPGCFFGRDETTLS